tara:strand:+ start:4990 stop:5184 length:195 start_codon:yes stop_codon:yes gene_type:complete
MSKYIARKKYRIIYSAPDHKVRRALNVNAHNPHLALAKLAEHHPEAEMVSVWELSRVLGSGEFF